MQLNFYDPTSEQYLNGCDKDIFVTSISNDHSNTLESLRQSKVDYLNCSQVAATVEGSDDNPLNFYIYRSDDVDLVNDWQHQPGLIFVVDVMVQDMTHYQRHMFTNYPEAMAFFSLTLQKNWQFIENHQKRFDLSMGIGGVLNKLDHISKKSYDLRLDLDALKHELNEYGSKLTYEEALERYHRLLERAKDNPTLLS